MNTQALTISPLTEALSASSDPSTAPHDGFVHLQMDALQTRGKGRIFYNFSKLCFGPLVNFNFTEGLWITNFHIHHYSSIFYPPGN